jgi:hypothetical protein
MPGQKRTRQMAGFFIPLPDDYPRFSAPINAHEEF